MVEWEVPSEFKLSFNLADSYFLLSSYLIFVEISITNNFEYNWDAWDGLSPNCQHMLLCAEMMCFVFYQ